MTTATPESGLLPGITAHACRFCGGRVFVRDVESGRRYRCAECGAEGFDVPESICGCGAALPGRRGKPLRFHCVANPNPGPGLPEVVIAEQAAA